ncbi:MAG: hypothetical protein KIH08_07925 [Candidatus Freyarchaeota archaeon]|nr:hypothetical protein [Candidatus Jordarchaeia archaeon]MBS7270265.1 hypothetical protein [Candidatus Jordarchaeia archaeon]MBS7280476.1 hypothetical protein [Candidatus Jordarchaeia archaeon]
MPKGVFVTYFDAVEGVVLKPEYIYIKDETRITEGLAQQLYFAHSTGETRDYLEIKIGNIKIASYYSGMVPKSSNQICIALLLEEREMGVAYKAFLKTKAMEIVKLLDSGDEINIREIYKELEKREKTVDRTHLMVRVLADEETWRILAALREGKTVESSILSHLKRLELVSQKEDGEKKFDVMKIRVYKAPSDTIINSLEKGRVPPNIRSEVGQKVINAIDELQTQIKQEIEGTPTDILEPLVNSTNYQIVKILEEEGITPIKSLAKRVGVEEETILYHVEQLKNNMLADYTQEYVYPLLKVTIETKTEEKSFTSRIKNLLKKH